eukprot:Nitzschia sp. Nitz4//scaffold183_size43938//21801//24764//NITZ4_007270-RA/size43938-augustus-gene-0.71-mRNA-1//1//CDS//3329539614//7154//frame0
MDPNHQASSRFSNLWQRSLLNRELITTDDDDDDSNSTETSCVNVDASSPRLTTIATWSKFASVLQAYLTAYQETQLSDSTTTAAQTLQITSLPTLHDLQRDLRYDIRSGSLLYDAFVVPPLLMGDLFLLEAADSWDYSPSEFPTTQRFQDSLLPYYKQHIASTLEDQVRALPLFAGSQLLLFYRKDYLQAFDLPVPRTWSEYVQVAAILHEQTLGPDGQPIYGSCMGRLPESQCRFHNGTQPCDSLSMSYLGMALSSITQVSGSSTGWIFDNTILSSNQQTMSPLLEPTLDRLLVFLEQMLRFGAPNELNSDASMNLDLFQQGLCAMTVSVHHPSDILNQTNVGYVPLPGSQTFLDRISNSTVNCTPNLCPYGDYDEDWGTINVAPFGAIDLAVAALSASATDDAKNSVQDFVEFILSQRANHTDLYENLLARDQPLSTDDLDWYASDSDYADMILSLTSSDNAAIPLQVPNALALWSILDDKVYEYLQAGDYSDDNREQLRTAVEASWDRVIKLQDQRPETKVTTAHLYHMSLGAVSNPTRMDLYIGTPYREIGWGVGGFSCLCSLFFALWVWRHSRAKVVRDSQPVFLYMICGGTFLMAGSAFPFGVEDDIAPGEVTDRCCMAAMWLYCMGYVVTFTALFAKIWRVNRVFRKARNLQIIRLYGIDIWIPFLVVLGSNLALLVAWNITDPVKWYRSPTDADPHIIYEDIPTYGYCDSDQFRMYFGAILGIDFVLSLTSLVQSYECRKVSVDYAENLWISGVLGSIVQIWIIGFPLLKLLDDDPRAVFFVKVGVVSLTSLATLFLIFLPKMRYHRQALRIASEEDGESPYKPELSDLQMGGDQTVNGLEQPAVMNTNKERRMNRNQLPEGSDGIRIFQMSGRHSAEVEKLQKRFSQAELRHRTLNDRLERLQENLEQYIMSRHPHGNKQTTKEQQGNHFILTSRSEQTQIAGGSEGSPGRRYLAR